MKEDTTLCSLAVAFNNNILIKIFYWITLLAILLIMFIYINKNKKISSIAKIGLLSSIFSGIFGFTALFSVLYIIPAIKMEDLKLKIRIS